MQCLRTTLRYRISETVVTARVALGRSRATVPEDEFWVEEFASSLAS